MSRSNRVALIAVGLVALCLVALCVGIVSFISPHELLRFDFGLAEFEIYVVPAPLWLLVPEVCGMVLLLLFLWKSRKPN